MEKFLKNFIGFLLLVFLFQSYLFCQNKSEKVADKIKLIQQQLEEKKKELEEYVSRQEELKLQLKSLKEDENKTSKTKEMIYNNLIKTQQEISRIKNRYDILKTLYETTVSELKNESASLYLKKFSFSDYYGTDTIIEEIICRNIIVEKYLLVKTLSNNTAEFEKNIRKLSIRKQEIMKEKEIIEEKLKKNRIALNEANKEIKKTQMKYEKLKQEIEELNRSAFELTNLVRKLEKQSPYKKPKNLLVNIPKNSLPWPVNGKVISKFGKEYINELKTWIVREGIKIKTDDLAYVHPVLSGEVIFSGAFRNYGNVVIINHGDNLYSIYGFLKNINVEKGVKVDENSIIGIVGDDLQAFSEKTKNVLYFEMRIGEESVDPLVWLKNKD